MTHFFFFKVFSWKCGLEKDDVMELIILKQPLSA